MALELIKKYPLNQVLAIYEFADRKALDQTGVEVIAEELKKGQALEAVLLALDNQKIFTLYMPATAEQIRAWLGQGYTPEDILWADQMAQNLDMTLTSVFDVRKVEPSWQAVGEKLGHTQALASFKRAEIMVEKKEGTELLYGESYESLITKESVSTGALEEEQKAQLKASGIDVDTYITSGFGIKEIENAIILSENSGVSVDKILSARASGQTWESVISQYNLSDGEVLSE